MDQELKHILAYLKKAEPSSERLKYLENDVWSQIMREKSEQPLGLLERILSFLFPREHRMVPIMGAVILGMIVSLSTLPAPVADTSEMLNFKVFKPKAIALAFIFSNEGQP